MPYSFPTFDYFVAGVLARSRPKSCLDIGAGAGKYGKMLREIVPDARLCAVEVYAPYVEQFQLAKIYDEVRVVPAHQLVEDREPSAWDAVILGDSLEHMSKSEGLDVVNYLLYRCRWMVIVCPEHMPQEGDVLPLSESHASFWTGNDFWGLVGVVMRKQNSLLFLIQGFLPRPGGAPGLLDVFPWRRYARLLPGTPGLGRALSQLRFWFPRWPRGR